MAAKSEKDQPKDLRDLPKKVLVNAHKFFKALRDEVAALPPPLTDEALEEIGERFSEGHKVLEDQLEDAGISPEIIHEKYGLDEVMYLIEGNLSRRDSFDVTGKGQRFARTNRRSPSREEAKEAALRNLDFFLLQLLEPEQTELPPFIDALSGFSDDVGWTHMNDLVSSWPNVFATPPSFQPGYEEDAAARANLKVWSENYGEEEGFGWWKLSRGILVRPDKLSEDANDALDGLDDYPLLDDEAFSEIEREDQEEAWADYARRDFKRDIQQAIAAEQNDDYAGIAELIFEDVGDSFLDSRVYQAYSDDEVYPEGSGNNINFPDAIELVFSKRTQWGQPRQRFEHTLDSLIAWLVETEDSERLNLDLATLGMFTIMLSDRNFCRVHPDDAITGTYEGARYMKYGENLVLQPNASLSEPATPLVREFRQDSNTFFWPNEVPTINVAADADLFFDENLIVRFNLVEQLKNNWFENYVTYALTEKVISIVTDAGLTCHVDPPEDMARDVAEDWLWAQREHLTEVINYDDDIARQKAIAEAHANFIGDAERRKRLSAYACEELKKLDVAKPPFCEHLRQMHIPGVEEGTNHRRRRRRSA